MPQVSPRSVTHLSTRRLVRALDMAVLLGIADLLGRHADRLPAAPADLVPVVPRHRWISGHWARALADEGLALLDDAGQVTHIEAPRRADLAAARRTITTATAGLGYPPVVAAYILDSLRALPALLRDDVSAQSLLFRDSTPDALYRENPVNRYLNAAAPS